MDEWTSSTSATRPADTAARGSMMNIIDSIRKAITICIVYCMKAIMSPTCIDEVSICCAPIQMIASDRPFISSIMKGNITTMTRLMKSIVPVRSRLAVSNRCSSWACRLKARITIMPERLSRLTRFRRSISCWMILNFGTATL